jgi:2-dehydro-3-deoxygluconokinase
MPDEASELESLENIAAARRDQHRVVTFGEAMIRLTPPRNERLERTISLDVTVGGAELNTAIGLQCLGIRASWVSCLPDNAPGRMIARQARANGVDVSDIHWVSEDEGRAGLYFLEEGVDPRPSSVTYDRKSTAIANVRPGSFDWEQILAGASAFHVSGISLAVSPSARAEAMEAVRVANELGIPVAFDLNYRSKLWSEAEAREAFVAIVQKVDILFASRGGLKTFFGIEGSHEEALRGAIARLGVAAVTLTRKRAKGSRRLRLQSLALGPSGVLVSSDWRDLEVVDRLGGGDAFAAGFIAGYLDNPQALSRAVQLGAAASALKHTMPGDFLCATRSEIEAAMDVSASGVLQR